MVYYSFALGSVPGFLLVNNVINGVAELVSVFLLAAFVSKPWFHRSKGLAILLVLTSLMALSFTILTHFSEDENDIYERAGRVFFFLGRSVVGLCFAVVYIYAGELFPTNVRNSCVGICSVNYIKILCSAAQSSIFITILAIIFRKQSFSPL